jgi:ABC-type proline/glycine betaine transport system substrate-binding protein
MIQLNTKWYNLKKMLTGTKNLRLLQKMHLKIQIGWGTSLESKSPAIVEFFKNFQLTADDVSAMAYAISVEKKQPADVARAWMDANKSTVDGWLGL